MVVSFCTHLLISLFWPLKANTVLIAESTSSATAPALAYAVCSLLVKLASTYKEKDIIIRIPAEGCEEGWTKTTQPLKHKYKDYRNAYFTEKCGWNAQRRAHSQDDKSEFPAFGEADDEGCDEGCVGLDQHPSLVANPLLDLIDITAHAKISMSTNDLQNTTFT